MKRFLAVIMIFSAIQLVSCAKITEAAIDTKITETEVTTAMSEKSKDYIDFNGKKWSLAFFDDFDGTELDSSHWAHSPEWQRKNRGGYWKDDAAYLDGKGNLVLDNFMGEEGYYHSGAIRSKSLFEQTYGYYEIKFKPAKIEGYWPSFWLMCDGMVSVGNGCVDGCEIDIFELIVREGYLYHTIHWDGYEDAHERVFSSYKLPDTFYDDYHTCALEWNKEEYIFYIDGVETWKTTAGGICEVPMYIKINTEIGDWAGEIDLDTLPSAMLVDYVKVYTLEE